ncbi:unnamed protein product, partial [Linum tenue]
MPSIATREGPGVGIEAEKRVLGRKEQSWDEVGCRRKIPGRVAKYPTGYLSFWAPVEQRGA